MPNSLTGANVGRKILNRERKRGEIGGELRESKYKNRGEYGAKVQKRGGESGV